MRDSVSVLSVKIERIVSGPTWRGTKCAKFQLLDGFFICEAWFEYGEPRMQIRSSAHTIEEAEIVSTGIQMAIEWTVGQIEVGEHLAQAKQATR